MGVQALPCPEPGERPGSVVPRQLEAQVAPEHRQASCAEAGGQLRGPRVWCSWEGEGSEGQG